MNDLDALLAEVEDTVGGNNDNYNRNSKTSNTSRHNDRDYSSSTSSYDRGASSSSSSSYPSSSSSSSSKNDHEWHKENDTSSSFESTGYSTNGRSNRSTTGTRSLDPLDDLLSLTEDTMDSPPPQRNNGNNSGNNNARNDYGNSHNNVPRYRSSAYPTNSMSSSSNSSGGGSTGAQVLLGGSECTLGPQASKFSSIATNRLLCLKCMCEVVRFENYHWEKDVDYMFFRNYWPEPERLSPKLQPKRGYAAYCCQCCWTSVRDIEAVGHDLKWVQPNE